MGPHPPAPKDSKQASVFDPDEQLPGVIAMSGPVHKVHPHTLGMVMTVSRAIEKEMMLQCK